MPVDDIYESLISSNGYIYYDDDKEIVVITTHPFGETSYIHPKDKEAIACLVYYLRINYTNEVFSVYCALDGAGRVVRLAEDLYHMEKDWERNMIVFSSWDHYKHYGMGFLEDWQSACDRGGALYIDKRFELGNVSAQQRVELPHLQELCLSSSDCVDAPSLYNWIMNQTLPRLEKIAFLMDDADESLISDLEFPNAEKVIHFELGLKEGPCPGAILYSILSKFPNLVGFEFRTDDGYCLKNMDIEVIYELLTKTKAHDKAKPFPFETLGCFDLSFVYPWRGFWDKHEKRKILVEFLKTFPFVGCTCPNQEKEYTDYISSTKWNSIGYDVIGALLSNRARWVLKFCDSLPLSAWPFALENAQTKFKEVSEKLDIQTQASGLYHILRKTPCLLMASQSQNKEEQPLNDNSPARFPFGTKVWNVVNGKKRAGLVLNYDTKTRLYKIAYECGDIERLGHSRVQECLS